MVPDNLSDSPHPLCSSWVWPRPGPGCDHSMVTICHIPHSSRRAHQMTEIGPSFVCVIQCSLRNMGHSSINGFPITILRSLLLLKAAKLVIHLVSGTTPITSNLPGNHSWPLISCLPSYSLLIGWPDLTRARLSPWPRAPHPKSQVTGSQCHVLSSYWSGHQDSGLSLDEFSCYQDSLFFRTDWDIFT